MILLLFEQLSLVVMMASQGESSIEISQFTSSGEKEDSMEDVAGAVTDETPGSRDDGVPIPDVLSHLVNHGIKFKSVSHWSKTARYMLKSLSVYFSVDNVVTNQAVLEAFDNAGINVNFITSIQWHASNRTWVVAFENQLAKETALEVSSFEIDGTTIVIGRLCHYGRVMSFRRDRIAQYIESGVLTAWMSLARHIPSVVNLTGEYVRVWYPHLPKSCCNCGALDCLV